MATFDELEQSVELSRPVEVYDFVIGSDQYRYTSAEGTVTASGVDYTPVPLKRGNPVQSREQKTTALTITLPSDDAAVTPFIAIQPSSRMLITIRRVQLDSVPAVTIVVFEGYVASIAFRGETAELRCIPFNELFTREMPRFQYQGLCNHVLYDGGCTLAAGGAFKHSGSVLGVTGRDVNVQSLPTSGDPFVGGYLEIPGGSEQRLIVAQSGTIVTLLMTFRANISGGTIDAFFGCDHTPETCSQKFSNIINYGGFPFVPTVNPFEQVQITKE